MASSDFRDVLTPRFVYPLALTRYTEEALALLEIMKDKGLQPSQATFAAVMHASRCQEEEGEESG